jgi:hypothetical protein
MKKTRSKKSRDTVPLRFQENNFDWTVIGELRLFRVVLRLSGTKKFKIGQFIFTF